MIRPECPGDLELLTWLREDLDPEAGRIVADHINSCESCQRRLDLLSETDGRNSGEALTDDLPGDLRQAPDTDNLESEPECGNAVSFAATITGFPIVTAGHENQLGAPAPEILTHLGHYEILGLLGQGGMGVVYKARNRQLARLVAVKVLPVLKRKDAGAVARFAREIKALGRLRHQNIVAALDADEADGKLLLVMEYIDGCDLHTQVKSGGPLSVGSAVSYILQAARGLQFAHEQGIIHRDVKPSNLMKDRDGVIKLLDLGLARFDSHEETQTELTETGMLMGTVDFLAPEQAENNKVTDRRADIYSLGCTLYFLLTGKSLYTGDSVIKKVLAHREHAIPSLSAACPNAPAGLADIFAKMVAKLPEDRYQSMTEVIAALERPWQELSDSNTVITLSETEPHNRAVRRRLLGSRAFWLCVAGLVFIGGLSAWLIPRLRNSEVDNQLNRVESPPEVRSKLLAPAIGTRAGQEWNSNELKMKFCWCPSGTFRMGSPKGEPGRIDFESPPKEVSFANGFWIGKFEVTQEEWERMTGTRPSRFQGAKSLPVENISWVEATRFCELLTESQRNRGALPPGWEFRLPTEAQWEYACRAGTTTAFSFGNDAGKIGEHSWFGYNSDIRPHEVGRKVPNAWGLHDMHGNVWEWCRDWFQPEGILGGTDPEVLKEAGAGRCIRGGGWECAASLCRSGFRTGQKMEDATHRLGFRVALVPASAP